MKGIEVFRTDGKVALITGGGAGIGKSCAQLLSKAGAQIFIVDIVEERALQVKQEIEAAGGSCAYAVADLSVEENCRQAVDACVAAFGKLDVLINSAGTQGIHGDLQKEMDALNPQAKSEEMTSQIYELVMQKNALGLFKSKEKQALQDKIDEVKTQKEAMRAKAAEEMKPIKAKMEPLKKRLDEVVSRLEYPQDEV